MRIRKAEKQDAVWLAERLRLLYEHAIETSGDAYLIACQLQPREALAHWFERQMAEQRSTIFVATIGNELVGFIRGQRERPFAQPSSIGEIGYLSMIWVEPGHRRKGVARGLVQRLEMHFRDTGLRYVDLHFMVGNQEADVTWQRLGYKPYRVAARKDLRG
ncbi:MAG TPA: GNAT family N-acetyltransferase [Clostridia bacterium]|nr:GNAT family N-acetyltransferase [Clostridia bacterium]